VREDAWLGERLGCTAWTVEGQDAVVALDAYGSGFYQAKVAAHDVDRVGALEEVGFRTIDVNITLRRGGGGVVLEPAVAVRDAQPADREAVVEIAEQDYSVSRFHLDPQIPNAVASAIKRDWADNFFRGERGDRLLVVDLAGRVIGFELVLDTAEESTIDLIAVAAPARGKGAGSALVSGLVASRPGHPVVVGTQVSNVAALRFYEHLGFTAHTSQFVLHRHR
jgi:ribosomal protein S18 acetylase RimI-like enzyme